MKALLAIDGLGPGGAERQFCLLCEGLSARVEVCAWALHGGPVKGMLESLGIPLVMGSESGGQSLSAASSAMSLAAGFRPDVIHSWGWISAVLMEFAAMRTHSAHVTGLVRMGTLPGRKRIRLLLASRLGRLAIGNSEAGLRAWRIPRRKARLVRNGFDERRAAGFQALPGSHERFRFVMAGSMSGHKDFATLIDAATALSGEHPGRFEFDLLGDGPDRSRLEERAKGAGCPGSITFHGRTEDAMPFLRDADAGVLLSPKGEGMSNFLMECMAAGLPVVCSAGSGNSELVREGVDGWLVPQMDVSALAGRLLDLSSDPALCARAGASGRARIFGEFSSRRMVEATLAVYVEAVSWRTSHGR